MGGEEQISEFAVLTPGFRRVLEHRETFVFWNICVLEDARSHLIPTSTDCLIDLRTNQPTPLPSPTSMTTQQWQELLAKLAEQSAGQFGLQTTPAHEVAALSAAEEELLQAHPVLRFQCPTGGIGLGPTTYDLFGLPFDAPCDALQRAALDYLNAQSDPRVGPARSLLIAHIASNPSQE